jgi:predicted dehydrogenase/threonine dehydrogenase-like Zn-dependent dehydrogenase
MKQVTQSFRTGKLALEEVSTPQLRARGILVRTAASVISSGTERMVLEFAEKNVLQKAKARPDLVRQVLDKVRREGLVATYKSVQNRLDQPLPLGYSSAGIVVQVGEEAGEFSVGDRVACAGSGYASHAELAYIPRTLAVKLPPAASFEEGAFVTLGAIALQAVRLAEVQVGCIVAVIGLGLLGQLALQILKAAGCKVLGVDLDVTRVQQALDAGADAATIAENAEEAARQFSSGRGCDAVIIMADSRSNDAVVLAGEIAREQATVVAGGAVGMEIPRKLYYEKELHFRVSRSYGPGRYDPEYEEKGQDYPYPYVRWTEQRNMEAFADLLGRGSVNVKRMITHRFGIDDASAAYQLISGGTGQPFLGVILQYPLEREIAQKIELASLAPLPRPAEHAVQIGVLGAGNFANAVLVPAAKKAGAELVAVVSASGLSSKSTAKRFGFRYCTNNESEILNDEQINCVAILTRHNLHARQVIAALKAGKHVFVEKPLCLNDAELDEIIACYEQCVGGAVASGLRAPMLMVGYNRRFAPYLMELRKHLAAVQEPVLASYRVNAGYLPPSHWTQDPQEGGGRLIGEGCHFIDLLLYLIGSRPVSVETHALPDQYRYRQDNYAVTIRFENGSIGQLTYVANGNKSFSKEALEIFGGGMAARLDDYSRLEICSGSRRITRAAHLSADKGHQAEWKAIVQHLRGKGPTPIDFPDLVASMRTTLAAYRSLVEGQPIPLAEKSS